MTLLQLYQGLFQRARTRGGPDSPAIPDPEEVLQHIREAMRDAISKLQAGEEALRRVGEAS